MNVYTYIYRPSAQLVSLCIAEVVEPDGGTSIIPLSSLVPMQPPEKQLQDLHGPSIFQYSLAGDVFFAH